MRFWLLVMVTLAALCGCEKPVVRWEPERSVEGVSGDEWNVEVDGRGRGVVVGSAVASAHVPLPADACPRSVAVARGRAGEMYAVWWAARADGSAALVVARSVDDGATWSAPVVADARDRGGEGCARPRPAIAADSSSAYVHIAYFLRPADGAGVWYTHSMEHGAIWHAPVGIAFGDDAARAAVAAQGDTVAVAYESPNAADGRVGLALSETAGHIFEQRLTVSGSGLLSVDPRVALRGRTIAVAWHQRLPIDTTRVATVVRLGQLQ